MKAQREKKKKRAKRKNDKIHHIKGQTLLQEAQHAAGAPEGICTPAVFGQSSSPLRRVPLSVLQMFLLPWQISSVLQHCLHAEV